MKENNDVLQTFFKSIPDHIGIMEEGIDLKTQKEYLEISTSISDETYAEANPEVLREIIFRKTAKIKDKKIALILLGYVGSIPAFRALEEYKKAPDQGLEKFTSLSMETCKRNLESTLLDENTAYIISGLGGKENRLRFYFLLLPLEGKTFTGREKIIISNELNNICARLNCIPEKIETGNHYASITVLIPMDVALGTLIESGIEECNYHGEFVFEYYYATNANIPDEEEIAEIIKTVMKG